MDYDNLYSFYNRIDLIGISNVGEFKDVVSEIRYFFVGTDQKGDVRERLFVLNINTDNLNKKTFIPLDKVTKETLTSWLVQHTNPINLNSMKKSIHEMFVPPILYRDFQSFF